MSGYNTPDARDRDRNVNIGHELNALTPCGIVSRRRNGSSSFSARTEATVDLSRTAF